MYGLSWPLYATICSAFLSGQSLPITARCKNQFNKPAHNTFYWSPSYTYSLLGVLTWDIEGNTRVTCVFWETLRCIFIIFRSYAKVVSWRVCSSLSTNMARPCDAKWEALLTQHLFRNYFWICSTCLLRNQLREPLFQIHPSWFKCCTKVKVRHGEHNVNPTVREYVPVLCHVVAPLFRPILEVWGQISYKDVISATFMTLQNDDGSQFLHFPATMDEVCGVTFFLPWYILYPLSCFLRYHSVCSLKFLIHN